MIDPDNEPDPRPELAEWVPTGDWHIDVDVPADPMPPPIAEPAPPRAEQKQPSRPLSEPPSAPPSMERIIEALLFVGGDPLTPQRAVEVVRGLTVESFHSAIDTLNQEYRRQRRPYAIVSSETGYTMRLRSRYRDVREKLFGGPRQVRLSQPAKDVLALIAYQQPITKAEIDTIRGSESGALIRQLLRLGLIAIHRGSDTAPNQDGYGTTNRFLEVFRLSRLEDLPRIGEWKPL